MEETVGEVTLLTVSATITNNPQMQALNDVVKAGWVRYIGMSSCFAWQCEFLCIPPTKGLSFTAYSLCHAE